MRIPMKYELNGALFGDFADNVLITLKGVLVFKDSLLMGSDEILNKYFGSEVLDLPDDLYKKLYSELPQKTDERMSKSVDIIKAGVPGPLEVARALSRLAILPNPADPALAHPIKFVESPWKTVPVPTVDPKIWDNAKIVVVNLDELVGTDLYLKRKKVGSHIESMGAAETPYRNYALVILRKGVGTIIDGHHRLMAQWLLGQDQAPVWLVEEN